MNNILFALLAVICYTHPAGWAARAAEIPISTHSFLPTHLALTPNLNDFTRFADGGPDANWYIGFNNAWIVKLPPAPAGEFSKAFIGARVGRAKTRPHQNRPWLSEVIAGKVYMAISPNPWFASEQTFFLVDTADVPVEPATATHMAGAGSAEWFWAEVPMAAVSFTGPNYLVVWSPTKYFVSASSSPILAAASADPDEAREPRAWNNRSISGVPPRRGQPALQTPINIHPALAVKLVPAVVSEVTVTDLSVRPVGRRHLVEFSAGGENISEAWVEFSRDSLDWSRISPIRRKPPFAFTLPPGRLPPGVGYVRAVARDNSGNTGHSEARSVASRPQSPYHPAPEPVPDGEL